MAAYEEKTVKELKELLESRGLATNGLKADLVARCETEIGDAEDADAAMAAEASGESPSGDIPTEMPTPPAETDAGTGVDTDAAALAAEGAPETGTAEDAAGAATGGDGLATAATVAALAMGDSAAGLPLDNAPGNEGIVGSW